MILDKRAIIIFLYFLLISDLSGYAKDDTVKLQLKWKHQFQFAGYYAAQLKGYYQEEGLKVIIEEYKQGRSIVKDVLDNTAQYGVYSCDILLDFDQGKPVKVIASIFQHSPYVIISPKDKKITKPTDLSGKKVMTGRGMRVIALQTLLTHEGISLDSVTILPYNRELQFSNKQIDALIAYKSTTPIVLKRAGFQLSIIEPSDYGVDFYGDILFTSSQEIDKHPDRVEAFRKASLKGWEYALEHPEEIANYILGLPGVKERGIDKQFLLDEATVITELIRPNLVEVGHINKGRWNFIYKSYKELGRVKGDKDLQKFIYSPDNIEKEHRRILVLIIIFLVFFVLLFILINIIIRRNLKLKEEKLQEADSKSRFNEESIQIILEHAGIILWNWDVSSYRFSIYGNEAIGAKIKNIEDFRALIHTKTLDKFDLFLDLLPNDFSQEILMKIDDEYQWRLLTIKARNYVNNRPISYMGMLIDISDIKKKQTHLEKLSKELKKSNVELEKFAYITSHNLRAPVVNLESLMNFYNYDAVDIANNNDIVSKMEISVKRLKETLDDLIEIVSKKSEKLTLENVNIKNELFNLIHKLDSLKKESNIQITTDVPEELNIICSKKVFHTIFDNLITNSVRFKKPDIPLKLTCRSFDTEEYVVVEIEDNGVGIDMERNAEKIFGLYQKFQPDAEGRGIGLFIVKSQVESVDGKIEISSKLQEGTTFRIYFRKQA